MESTIQQVIEQVFRDEDGMLRSGVNGLTMKPMRIEDVTNRPDGLGIHTENSSIPRSAKPVWLPAAAYNADWLVKCIGEVDIPHNSIPFAIDYLTTAHRLFPDKGYNVLLTQYMKENIHRKDFYHIKRGRPLAKVPKLEAGDDYLNVFWCENHVHWLIGYWNNRLSNPVKND